MIEYDDMDDLEGSASKRIICPKLFPLNKKSDNDDDDDGNGTHDNCDNDNNDFSDGINIDD